MAGHCIHLSLFMCLTCALSSHSPCNLICACVVCTSVHCSLLILYCTCMSVWFTVHFCSERWLLSFPSPQSLCHRLPQVSSRRASECNLAASYTGLCICSFVSTKVQSLTSLLSLLAVWKVLKCVEDWGCESLVMGLAKLIPLQVLPLSSGWYI